MARNDGFVKVESVGVTLFRGIVLALLTGSVLFVLIPQAIVRILPLLHSQ